MFRDLGVSGGSQADSSLAWLLAPHTVTITRLVIIIYTLISLSKTSKRFDLLSLSYLSFAGSRHIAYWVHIACWVQHFPQHHLSGSGIAQLEVYHCQEPAWGTPPVAKVMRKEARHMQRRNRASGVPLEILEHLSQNQSLPTFCFVLSPTPLTLRGAVPHYLSLKKELAYSSS